MAPADDDASQCATFGDRFGAKRNRAMQRREQMRSAVGVSLGVVAGGMGPVQQGPEPEKQRIRGPGLPRPGGMSCIFDGAEPSRCAEPPGAERARPVACWQPQAPPPDPAQHRPSSGLRAQVQVEVTKQREREAAVAAREDSLSQFLAEKSAAAVAQKDDLEAKRRAVPGLSGAPSPSHGPRACAGRSSMEQGSVLPRCRPQQGTSSNVWASGADQNSGNVLSERPTSKVLKPPGGGGSLQLGGW